MILELTYSVDHNLAAQAPDPLWNSLFLPQVWVSPDFIKAVTALGLICNQAELHTLCVLALNRWNTTC